MLLCGLLYETDDERQVMNSDIAIQVEDLSKCYTLHHPILDGEGSVTRELWALNAVSFEIRKGESVGILGPNGSGKSTLLKILAGVTKPSAGKVTIRGRVASILDVGAGFHPELSGRENVFLNGQLLGFSRKEIEARLDEILEFSGIDRFIEEPVKNYSNGMYLRLAFSIMAHLDFDVYLLDEVLSVGDAAFRNKISQKFNELKDKTVVYAFHGLSGGIMLDRDLYLKQGRLSAKTTEPELSPQAFSNQLLSSKGQVEFIAGDVNVFIQAAFYFEDHFLCLSFTTTAEIPAGYHAGLSLFSTDGLLISDFILDDFRLTGNLARFDLDQLKWGQYYFTLLIVDGSKQQLLKTELVKFETSGFRLKNDFFQYSTGLTSLSLEL